MAIRDVPAIWAAWRSGTYIGDTRASTRVTVERDYWLRTTGTTIGQWDRGPARWFQRDITGGAEAAGQVETEVPGLVSVNISRSIDTDAGTCDFVVRNYVAPTYGAAEVPAGQLGEPGYYTFDHGQSQDARARWGHMVNPWNEVLVPNALVRTYQGFGGQDKTITQAVADGNLVLNGVWLVDTVTVSTDGNLSVKCRDMGKLLVDQLVYPPLVPSALYPVSYRRFTITRTTIGDADPSGWATATCIYRDSSIDHTYGAFNTGATGHPPADAYDWTYDNAGNMTNAHQMTYWLSEPCGSVGDQVWSECDVIDGVVNNVYVHPWAGNYLVMVSVMENGQWVPPEESGLGGWTADGVPYVATITANWEGGQPPGLDPNTYWLPRIYRAERIRFTFTNLVRAPEGGYRAGARKLIAGVDYSRGYRHLPLYTSASIPPNDQNREGYWQCRADGNVYAFGDASVLPVATNTQHVSWVVGMAAHPNGLGYWTLDMAGCVVGYGTAQGYNGDPFGAGVNRDDFVDFAFAPDGNGWWALCKDGAVYNMGGAGHYGNATVAGTMPSGGPVIARSIESHPSVPGYWVLLSDGTVQAFNLPHYGNANRAGFTVAEYVASIRRTSTGNGYWVPSGGGIVQAFGDATHHGNGVRGAPAVWADKLVWDIIPSSASDRGYAVQHADGNLDVFGDFSSFGSYGAHYAEARTTGNYTDYSQIVRDLLLWAGFHLYGATPENGEPPVYANIESTGTFSKEPLTADTFDKKSVAEAIKVIQQIVAYVTWVDAEGSFRFESPNWFGLGNYSTTGRPLGFLPEIDERVNLRQHSVTRSADAARSEIVIANTSPVSEVSGQPPPPNIQQTRMTPLTATDLKGMVVPALWANGVFLDERERNVLADLVAMGIWFRRRVAQVNCVANPLIEPNDQVRVYERQTGEVFVHYVRGTNITHDLDSGDFSMTLDTHWLGGSAYGHSSLYYTCDMRPQRDGYWQCNAFSQVVPFGEAQAHTRPTGQAGHRDWVVALRTTPSGEGFYTLDLSGRVNTWGDATFLGEITRAERDAADLAVTPSGSGYWIVRYDGVVHAFGDAVHLGNVAVAGAMPSGGPIRVEAIESHPDTMGYWVMLSDGTVHNFGLPHYGNANRNGFRLAEYVGTLRRTPSGSGYYIPSGGGILQAFGDAVDRGDGQRYPDDQWVAGLVWSMLVGEDGYALQHADGNLDTFNFPELGAANAWAGPTAMWGLMTEEQHTQLTDPMLAHPVSLDVMRFLARTGSVSAQNAVAANFGLPAEPAIKARTDT